MGSELGAIYVANLSGVGSGQDPVRHQKTRVDLMNDAAGFFFHLRARHDVVAGAAFLAPDRHVAI
ncbi:hypothetical protein C1D09_014840 [Mesorhizobium intechi]|uniref:Uncharacterized protein n=1 Tax=Mesorhizobium intechi TaxID=537601 RepID=A0A8T9ASU0_9HYPH|nr:hypothetical protein [Mesorhizobium intechi]TSE10462.1 hypothetical protein C1D09_014840 [Mesorhizobium intechi]